MAWIHARSQIRICSEEKLYCYTIMLVLYLDVSEGGCGRGPSLGVHVLDVSLQLFRHHTVPILPTLGGGGGTCRP